MESKSALQNRVEVAVRVRPQFIEADACCVTCKKDSLEMVNHRDYTQNIKYKFTTVFDADSTQDDVYKTFVAPKLDKVFNGKNMSVLAYGATGTGKTYTMIGTSDKPGIVPQALRDLFQTIETATNGMHTYRMKLSFLEIYNEKVIDLLIVSKSDLQIWEDTNKNIIVHRLSVKEIASYEEFESIFLPAMSQRTTVSSNLNSHSSRSHTILMVIIEKTQVYSPFRTSVSKIQFVDLAGSENNKLSGNKGLRMRESSCINKSLFVLHEVVDAVRSGQKRIPYRDSKLTRLLQDSFGGRSSALLLATIAPEERCYYNTYCTLNFATKSKKIVNNPAPCQEDHACDPNLNVDNLQLDVVKEPVSSDISVGNASGNTSGSSIASPTSVDLEYARELLQVIKERSRTLRTTMEKENHSEKNKETTGGRYISNTGNIIDSISKTENSETLRLCPRSSSSRVTFDMEKQSHNENQMSNNTLTRNAGILKNIENSTPLRPIPTRKCHSEIRKRRYSETDIVVSDSSKDDEILIKHRHKTHKNHILCLLNSENKADILLLHTVGTRRANLIYNWQQKHGPFQKVEDLYQILDLGEKYVSTFMHRNFLHFDEENMDSGC
ncbi:kinesin-like protein KIF22 isoform X1 [Octopus bimaculoides]|uniref:Kinesin-like protein n=1 Tax=Octopus bimaculoides TaxID=37653 RepID=A0A0L8G3X8_OCTBM|nr:kinesin-like protein KIF22 isoform X1 [Octopus bimaculoides]